MKTTQEPEFETIGINMRGVDAEQWRRFRIESIRRKTTMTVLLNEAVAMWLAANEEEDDE